MLQQKTSCLQAGFQKYGLDYGFSKQKMQITGPFDYKRTNPKVSEIQNLLTRRQIVSQTDKLTQNLLSSR